MKRMVSLLLALLLIFATGCSSGDGDSSAATAPVESTAPAKPFDINDYCGPYDGKAYFEIMQGEGGAYIILYMESNESGSRTAEIHEEILPSDVVDRKVTIPFMDSWGNSGKMDLEFQDKAIVVSIAIDSYDSSAMFSVSEGTETYYLAGYGDMGMSGDPGDPIDPGETAPTEPGNPAGILIGGIYYDDVAGQIPISVEQIKRDIVEQELNKFYVNSKSVTLDIARLMVIKGDCRTDEYGKVYDVYVHMYCTNGSITYEKRIDMQYELHDVGGWVYFNYDKTSEKEFNGTTDEMFCPVGRKNGQFRYDDYPSGMPISMGELADDILYANVNCYEIDGQDHYFNIDSIRILQGDFGRSDDRELLDLDVEINFSSETHTGWVKANLKYRNYDAGGWELNAQRYVSSVYINEKEFQPKEILYSDAEFLEAAKYQFSTITLISTTDGVNDSGEKMRTFTYDAERKNTYLTQRYKIILTAEYTEQAWKADLNIMLVDVEYTHLLGIWEYRVGDNYIRMNIKDVSVEMNGEQWNWMSKTVITYDVETSDWATTGYTEENQTGVITLKNERIKFGTTEYWYPTHYAPQKFTIVRAGDNSYDSSMEIGLHETKGIYMMGEWESQGITQRHFGKVE